jgi:hypothetical protein
MKDKNKKRKAVEEWMKENPPFAGPYPKKELKNSLETNVYKVLRVCVDRGIDAGMRRAHKHTGTLSDEVIKQEVEHCIMFEISKSFIFNN